MSTIRKRGNRWQVQVRMAGQNLSKSFTNKNDAKAWGREQEGKIDRGAILSGDTLSEVIDRYIAERSPDTNRVTMLNWWKEQLGKKKLHELRKADVIAARDGLKDSSDLAPATINRRAAALSAVLTVCTDEWCITESNPARIKSLPENNARDRLVTPQERKAILAACEAHDQPALLPMVLCAMYSGARAGELLDLRASDLDLERGLAIVRDTKNGDTRTIPISGNAKQALKDYLEAHPVIGNAFVFRNVGGGIPFRYAVHWADAKRSAKIDDLRFHDLRHDAASNLARDGASLAEIGAVLGHRSPAMSQRYSHYVTDHIAELGERIAKRID